MVKLNKIYTRTGDDGTTGLASGARVPKASPRVEAYGTVDETNAAIGLARLHTTDHPEWDAMLNRIQHDLFDLGADLSTPQEDNEEKVPHLRIAASQVQRLEHELDALNESLAPLNSFVLPGGSPLAAQLHAARTVARRAERLAFALAEREQVNPHALEYLNRLSDFLFVLSRSANENGARDVLWQPGINR